MILEMLGIGIVLPAITFLAQGGMQNTPSAMQVILVNIGDSDKAISLSMGVLVLVGIYLSKTLFLSYMIWKQTKFAFEVQAALSNRIFSAYLKQPYYFHLQRNSAQLIRNVTTEVNQFTFTVMLPFLTLLTESFVLLGLLVLLIVVEPIGTITIFTVIGSIAYIFHFITKERITRWGERRQFHEGKRIQHIQQGLGSIKDVMLMKRENYFFEQFSLHNVSNAKMGEFQKTLSQLPRVWLEFVTISGVLLLVFVLFLTGADNVRIMAMLGFFGLAAFRLLPSINRILASVQVIRYGIPVIDLLTEESKLNADHQHSTNNQLIPFSEEIVLKKLRYTYPTGDKAVLYDVSLTIRCGEAIGIIGSSGAGKSTLIDIILGLLSPDSGDITIDRRNINKELSNWQMQIGYVPQTIYLMDDTLRRNIAFGIKDELIKDSRVEQAIVDAQLKDFVSSLPDGLETKVGERGVLLSGGQIQRIGIARALYNNPSILVLDEATSSLDTANEKEVMKAIRAMKGDKTMIIVTHRLSTVELCDRIYKMESGRVIKEGVPGSML